MLARNWRGLIAMRYCGELGRLQRWPRTCMIMFPVIFALQFQFDSACKDTCICGP